MGGTQRESVGVGGKERGGGEGKGERVCGWGKEEGRVYNILRGFLGGGQTKHLTLTPT